MNPLFAQLALDWLDAERAADPVRWPNATPKRDDMTVAIDRVYQVITGNVLWSEASPGDKAIWKSRVEDIPTFARSWNRHGKLREGLDQSVPRGDDPYNQTTPRPVRPGRQEAPRRRYWWNYYDTLEVDDNTQRSTAMFGNKNIGMFFLSNLQIPGQMGSDSSFSVHRLYVSVSSLHALHWCADRCLFHMTIGYGNAVPYMFLRDLFRGVDLSTAPLEIPSRQNFQVRCEFRDAPSECPVLPFNLTFHIEGYETRPIY